MLPGTTLPSSNRPALVEWQRQAAELQRSMQGASSMISDTGTKLKYLKESLFSISKPTQEFTKEILDLEEKLRSIQRKMNGDRVADRLDLDIPPGISARLSSAIYDGYNSTSDPTFTMKEQLQIAQEEFDGLLNDLKNLIQTDLKLLEQKLEAAGAPYTPGRLPEFKKN